MRIKCFTSPDMGENCYIVTGDENKEAAVIDPGNSVKAVLSYVEREGLEVKYILQTHAHFDHMCGAEKIKAATGALIYLTHEETRVAENSTYNLSAVFGGAEVYSWDKELSIGDKISFGGTYCTVILTPGHTCGGCCFYFEQEGAVFSGDTLFMGSVGRTDFPTGNAETLRKSIIKSLFVLPDDTKVFSGHGMSTTIGYEKKNNIYVF
jgi:glyoxylase-like metal-dependent hydrolase (beta-lactamase superfamily II)